MEQTAVSHLCDDHCYSKAQQRMSKFFIVGFVLLLVCLVGCFLSGMELKIEQHSVLKFLVSTGAMPINYWRELCKGFSNETPSQKMVRKWHKQFREGSTSTKDNLRSG